MNSEVLIIGGGVIGLSIARELHKKGVGNITILERGAIGKESSYAAAGMLAPQAEADEADEFFHLCDESNRLYPQFAAGLFDETGVDVELDRSGTLYLAFTDADTADIQKRFEWQTKAKLKVEHLTASDTRKIEPFVSPDVREALFFQNDWQVENRKLLAALQKYAVVNRIEIVADAEVKNLLVQGEKAIGAETANGKYFAATVVFATGAWTSLIKIGDYDLPKVSPIRGQMISYKLANRLFSKVIYSPRGYIVPRLDGRILAGATVEAVGFDKSVTAGGRDFLLENALEIAPRLGSLKIVEQWAGLRPFAADGLPILGAFPEIENLFIATAHYRNGILLAPKTAEMIAAKIVGTAESKFLEIFSPRRFFAAKG